MSPTEAPHLVAIAGCGDLCGARLSESVASSPQIASVRVGYELLGMVEAAYGVRARRRNSGERQSFLPRPRIGFYPAKFSHEDFVSERKRDAKANYAAVLNEVLYVVNGRR